MPSFAPCTALALSGECVMVREALVAVIDDDQSVRESLPDLLKELGYAARAFASAEEFLTSGLSTQPGCLILDIAMPGMSGPELQRELTLRGYRIPIIFITAQTDGSIRSTVMKQGAIDCLLKPFNEEALRMALQAAMP